MFKKKVNTDLEVLERKMYNLSKLVNINNIINSTLDIGKLLTLTMSTIKDIMETDASTLLLYEEETDDLVFKVALGEAGKELTEKYRVKLGQGIAGWVAESRKPLYINDVYKDRRFDPEFDRKTGFVTKSMICSPLLFKGKLLGVIQAINPLTRPVFTDEDINLFEIFSNQAALAVQNAIYFQNALEEERIQSELSSARSIQDALMPDIDMKLGKIGVAARSMPAREMGGEFHSIIQLDEGHLGIALGDLHEKGIPGGLHASIVSGGLKSLASVTGKNPYRLIRKLHDTMIQDLKEMHNASIFYGVVNINENNLRFCNAGVAYPILVRNGVARYLRFGKKSLQQDLSDVKSIVVTLKPGDFFVIISGGIINVKSRAGKQFGLKSVMDHLQQTFDSPVQVIESIVKRAEEFSAGVGIREDVSIIVLQVQ